MSAVCDRTIGTLSIDQVLHARVDRSINVIGMSGAPADADLSRWAMLYDGSVYRQYVGRVGDSTTLYQFGFNGASYDFGHRSIPQLSVQGMPDTSDTTSFSMLHDGADYRFYHLDP